MPGAVPRTSSGSLLLAEQALEKAALLRGLFLRLLLLRKLRGGAVFQALQGLHGVLVLLPGRRLIKLPGLCRAGGHTLAVLIAPAQEILSPGLAQIRRLPVEKDDTDTLAAIRAGLEQGCTDFLIYGGTGGKRLDHTLANLQSLLFLRRRGGLGFLFGDDFLWTVIENEDIRVRKTVEWGLLSVFCLGDRAEGVEETGVQYPLKNAVLTPDFPLGVSNHILETEARVSVRRGALAVGWELPPFDLT